jgi:predicted nuclease of predicted toxin-antitoxin system
MLAFLLDVHISPKVAEQIAAKRPDIPIQSLRSWREGKLREAEDAEILDAASEGGLTLVTYDQKTIVTLIVAWMQENREHAGVLFVDDRTIAQDDIGTQVRSLIAFWDAHHQEGWKNGVSYLHPPVP